MNAESELYVMVDSGADDHCAPECVASWVALEPCEMQVRNVQGGAIVVYGRRRVLLVLACIEKVLRRRLRMSSSPMWKRVHSTGRGGRWMRPRIA